MSCKSNNFFNKSVNYFIMSNNILNQLPLEEVKHFLRVTHNTDDALITNLITAAIEYLINYSTLINISLIDVVLPIAVKLAILQVVSYLYNTDSNNYSETKIYDFFRFMKQYQL